MMKKFTILFSLTLLFGLFLTKNVQALSGTYTIGSSGTYATFSAARSALYSQGVTGPVTFNVLPGTYNERLDLSNSITGASAINTITFDGANKSLVTLQYSGTTYATVRFYQCDYVTIKNMTIKHTSTSRATAVHFRYYADHNTIENCHLEVPISGSSNIKVIMFSANDYYVNYGHNYHGSYNLFQNNVIKGGYYGVHMRGSSSSGTYNHHNQFIGNEFTNQYYYSMYFYYNISHLTIKNNTFHNYGNSSAYAIYLYYYNHDNTIDGNIIHPGRYGIYMYRENYYGGNSYVINNMISNFQYSSYQAGITLYYYCYRVNILHNSIECKGSSSSYQNACIYTYRYPRYSIIKNNILSAPNYYGYCLSLYYYPYYLTIDYNAYYYPSGSHYYKFYGHYSNYMNLNNWQSFNSYIYTPHDQNSWSGINPQFNSSSDLHRNYTAGAQMVAPFLSQCDHDFDGEARPTTTTMIGADQVTPAWNLDIVDIEPKIAKMGNNTVSIIIGNRGANTIPAQTLNLHYKIDNGSWISDSVVLTSNLVSFGDINYTFPVQWNNQVESSHDVCVKIDPQIPNDVHDSDVVCQNIETGMEGPYSIDFSGSGDYVSFATAIADLNSRGVVGPVTFTVAPGTYNEKVTLTEIPFASSVNTVTFKGADRSTSILTYGGSNSTLYMNGVDYVTFDNMTIKNTHTSSGIGVLFRGHADYNTISNNNILLYHGTGGNMVCVTGSNSDGSASSSGENGFHNLIKGNLMDGGYYGIRWNGNTGSPRVDYDNDFYGNTLTNQYYYGYYNYYSGGNNFDMNRISSMRNSNAYGVYLNYSAGDTVTSNIINPGRYGIYIYRYNNNYNSGWYSLYANNMISNFNNTSYNTGIYLYYYCYRQLIYNNTIWVDGSYSSYGNYNSAIYSDYRNYYSEIKNNTLISTNRTYLMYLYYPYNHSIDYNLFYYPTGNYKFYFHGNRTYNSYKSYTSYCGTHDQNSLNQVFPEVISETDLHLGSGSKGFVGQPLPQLTYDADGDMRCRIKTYFGADEPYHVDIPIDFIASDTMCYLSPTTFINSGSENDPHTTSWYVNGNYMSSDFHYTHSFTAVKYDTVSLVMETCFRADTMTRMIFIDSPSVVPFAEFAASNNVVEIGEDVYFSDLSIDCPTGWQWEISPDSVMDPYTNMLSPAINWLEGTADTSTDPVLDFNYMGVYDVCMTPSNQHGAGIKKCKNDYIIVKFSDNICGQYNRSTEMYGNLYDDGGPNDPHGTNKNCNYLIKSCGSQIKITFREFNLGTGGYLRLYDGINPRGIPMWDVNDYGPNGISGYIGNPGFDTTLYSTQSGMVYIEFQTGGSPDAGFKLEWATTPGGTYTKPIASFITDDTNCVVYPVVYTNTSYADPLVTEYSWDYDGNGVIDATTIDGTYQAIFPGITATFISRLFVENCGGIDTATKTVIFINPKNIDNGDFHANSTKPVINQNIVTLFSEASTLSCVNKWDWNINPTSYYYVNGTDKNSGNPQIIFTDTVCYDVSVTLGNTNSTVTDTISKTCYITPIIHCSPTILNTSTDVGISRVRVGDIDYVSGVGENNGYSNFTNVASTELITDQSYKITVDRITNFNSMSRRVWIDYNRNGDFTDAGELVAQEDSSYVLSWNKTFTIPTTAEIGATTMRIGAVFGVFPTSPCGPNYIGETEDYRVVVSPDKEPPAITFIPITIDNITYVDTVLVELGYVYVDPGATAWDNLQFNVTNLIVTTDNVNVNAEGVYYVNYDVCDSLNNCANAYRVIIVTPDVSPPVITLIGGDPGYVAVHKPFQDPGYSAYDMGMGDITHMVTISGFVDTDKLGSYYVTYSVTDNQGLSDVKSRTIIVADVAAPDISLNGDSLVYHEINTPYVDSGVTYSDNYWSNNKITYQESGLIDINRIGTYTIDYSVTDASGNGPNTVVRTVIVWDSTAPVLDVKASDEIIVEVFHEFIDPGLDITDNSYFGFTTFRSGTFFENFPNSIPDSIGLFPIFYYVTDEAGNSSEVVARVVKVVDIRAPEIELRGEIFQFVERWAVYEDEGYDISDNYYSVDELKIDTSTTLNLSVDNAVLNEEGLYNITYTARDGSRNFAVPVVRLIKVIHTNTSIEESNAGIIDIYPNPSLGKFTIDINLPQGEEARISILDVLGEEIEVVNDGYVLSKKFNIDLSDKANGIYIVKIQTNEETVLERVMIGR